MQGPDPELQRELRSSFEAFRENPAARLAVKIRRVRAEAIRSLLLNSDAPDLETFNREVWCHKNQTLLNGVDITGRLFDSLDLERVQTLERALETGALELQGNYVWSPSGATFASKMTSDEREKAFHQFLRIVRTPHISGYQTAQRLMESPGFGLNDSNCMAMMLHPQATIKWHPHRGRCLDRLGYDVPTFNLYLEGARRLKILLGAEDFLELDLFIGVSRENLYKRAPWFWWVNQDEVRFQQESSGGYLFAEPVAGKSKKAHGIPNISKL